MNQPSARLPTSKWGRSRFGGSSKALIFTSLGAGAILAAGAGALFATFSKIEKPWLAFAIMTVGVLAPFCALVWALLVDRLTITGVTKRPEESVENTWYDQAASGTFTDMLLIMGVTAAVFSIFRIDVNSSLLIAALILIMTADFGVRYLLKSRRAR
ncbi:hypothetical protein V5R04_14390 [Jonesiaceae bacterium BS-20]|uniref:Uncharacterized protein n=1 Tax=Jonesiaceae bacterium BS-20 TaxID=3120821 RepID=A0AAU7DT82_9MICO